MNPSSKSRQGTASQPVSAWTLLQEERPSWPLIPAPSAQTTSPHSDSRQHQRHQQQPRHGPITLTPGITELAGPAGSGKTQIALHLCLQCATTPVPLLQQQQQPPPLQRLEQQKPPLQEEYYHAIYICMGPSSSLAQTKLATRLEQMALAQLPPPTPPLPQQQQPSVRPWLSRIWLRMIHNMDEFHELMNHDLPRQFFSSSSHCGNQRTHPVGVLVLDSLANLVRSPNDFSESTATSSSASSHHWIQQRTAMLFLLAAQLKRWADDHQLTVLVINQVTQSTSNQSNHSNGGMEQQQQQPALGLAWASCINTSIWLTRRERHTQDPLQPQPPQRKALDEANEEERLVRSSNATQSTYPPSRPQVSLQRHVTPDGINEQRKHQATWPTPSPWHRTIQVRFSPSLPTWTSSFTITTAGPILTD